MSSSNRTDDVRGSRLLGWLRLGFHAGSLAVIAHSVVWLRQLGLFGPFLLFMFTMWGLVTLAAFLTTALIVDAWVLWASSRPVKLSPRPESDPLQRRLMLVLHLHELLFALAFFFAFIVTVIFWGLFFYDRELIFPRAFVFPALLNHIQHTMPIVVLTLELIAFHRRPRPLFRHLAPISTVRELSVLVGGVVAYLCLTAALYAKVGRWPYPFMSGFSFSVFLAFTAAATVMALLISSLLRWTRIRLHHAPPPRP
jgi:hypothetical protein